jgi:hypothetical protein
VRRTTELRSGDRRTDPDVSPELGSGDVRAGGYRGGEARPVPTNIYRARRPAVAVMLIVPAVVVGLLLVRALALSAFGGPFVGGAQFVVGGIIGSCLGLAALPLLVTGLYGLITGAAHGAEQWGPRVWLRPPLAYLLVGIAFVLAAGMAVG